MAARRVRLSSNCLRSLISRAILEAPITRPVRSFTGEMVTETGNFSPLFLTLTVSEWSNPFSGPDLGEDFKFNKAGVPPDEAQDGLTYDFVRCIAENPPGDIISAGNDSVEVLANDGVVGGIDDGSEEIA